MTAMRSMDAARSGGALFRRRLISRSDVKACKVGRSQRTDKATTLQAAAGL